MRKNSSNPIERQMADWLEACFEKDLTGATNLAIAQFRKVAELNLEISESLNREEDEAFEALSRQHKLDQESLEKPSNGDSDSKLSPDEIDSKMQNLAEYLYDLKVHKVIGKGRAVRSALFMYSFSILDAFISSLLRSLYANKPELLGGIKKEVSILDLMKYKDVGILIEDLIADDLEDFRRESYVQQFENLERRFGVILRKFPEWPQFVETAQRRNLVTHCSSKVSRQYLAICRECGCKLGELEVGDELPVGKAYLKDSIELLIVTAVMLAQTLWRKTRPAELADADGHLNSIIYRFLREKQYKLAERLSDFGLSQKKISKDSSRKILTVNKGIALLNLGKRKELNKLLEETDWSSTSIEFVVGKEILSGNIEAACSLLERIGPSGEYIDKDAYLEWPLFDSVRDDKRFQALFRTLFEEEIGQELTTAIAAAEAQAITDSNILEHKTTS